MTLELVRLENGVFYGSGGHDCHPAFVRVALRNRWATPYGLDIREFVQAEHAEFAPVARFLRAAERKPRVRCDKSIDKRSEEHTSELQSLMRTSYAVFCLKKKNTYTDNINNTRRVIHHNTSTLLSYRPSSL